MQHPESLVTRRGLLATVPVAALAAGCRWGPEGSDASSGTTPRIGEPRDADQDRVDETVALVRAALNQVEAVAEARPGLATRLVPFRALHTAHLHHLSADAGPAQEVNPPDRSDWSAVVRTERALRDHLVRLAGTASSGILARSLASMAAGIAQLLAPSGPEDGLTPADGTGAGGGDDE